MKDLIVAVKAQLQAQIAYLKDVPIVPDVNALYDTTPFPCVALKDGPEEPDLFGGGDGYTCTVFVIPYVEVKSIGAMIVGKSGLPGVLDIEEDVKAALIRWSPAGYTFQNLLKMGESRVVMAADRGACQQKIMPFQWVKG